jgi:plasmid maintenance system antidote protein VapI
MKPAISPGEILLEDYLVPMGISQNALAGFLGISPGLPQVAVDKSFRNNA